MTLYSWLQRPSEVGQQTILNPILLVYLHWGESIVFQKGQADDWHQQKLHTERVILRVVCVPEAHVDHVDSGIGQSQEHHLKEDCNTDYEHPLKHC